MASAHRIVFKVQSQNAYRADVGRLLLYEGDTLLLESSAFSGFLKSPAASEPIPTETYRIRLDIKQIVNNYPWPGDTLEGMHHWYGIEKVEVAEWQFEWGRYRAALNERDQKMAQAYRGNFLHGKVREGDYTHGCICERSESILGRLWTLKPQKIAVEVVR